MKRLVKFVREAISSDEYLHSYAKSLCNGDHGWPHVLAYVWCDNCAPGRDGPNYSVIGTQLDIMHCEFLSEKEKAKRVKELFRKEDMERAIQDFIRAHGTMDPQPEPHQRIIKYDDFSDGGLDYEYHLWALREIPSRGPEKEEE